VRACRLGLAAALAAFAPLAAAPAVPAHGIALEEAWIPMPDGVRLAVDLYLPADRDPDERHPVLLEYLPYRKDEGRGYRYGIYSYFVERDYVVARVDIRGTGNSEGRLIPYEYSERENDDGEAVIAWLAEQPFSTGAVGMFGISWGGFNSIHLAMRNPPALKAILAVDATDDLYQDDVHFMDGILHVDSWEMSQDLDNARPGAPAYRIDEVYFHDRFDTEPWMMTYKRQQRDGPFWDRTALKARYEAIRVPTFVIGGWYDGYRDSVPRMLERLEGSVKAIVGPWSHAFPHDAYPKPRIEWRHEAVRWFDHWLRGVDTGITEEPRFAVYVRRWHPPDPKLEEVPGEWRFEEGWPIARTEWRSLYPGADHELTDSPKTAGAHELRYVPTAGIEASGPVMWWGDVAPDQRPTDAWSLVYDSAVLAEEIEILGLPRARLAVSADAPLANWVVRLSDVAPDGSVTQVAGAALNGAHRESAYEPRPLVPGEVYEVEVELHFTSWVFAPGHRIRLAVNNSQWPMLWPSRYPATTTLHLGADASLLELPVIPFEDRPRPGFLEPEPDPELPGYGSIEEGTISGYGEIARVIRDTAERSTTVVATNGGGSRYPWGTERYEETITHRADDDEPATASVVGEHRTTVEVDGRVLVWEATLDFRSDLESFFYTYVRRLFENGELVREKTWTDVIPRDHQ
jgi:putative CocE/NonD family hydrolase